MEHVEESGEEHQPDADPREGEGLHEAPGERDGPHPPRDRSRQVNAFTAARPAHSARTPRAARGKRSLPGMCAACATVRARAAPKPASCATCSGAGKRRRRRGRRSRPRTAPSATATGTAGTRPACEQCPGLPPVAFIRLIASCTLAWRARRTSARASTARLAVSARSEITSARPRRVGFLETHRRPAPTGRADPAGLAQEAPPASAATSRRSTLAEARDEREHDDRPRIDRSARSGGRERRRRQGSARAPDE